LPVVKTWVTSTVNREVAGSNPAIRRCKAIYVAQWQSATPGRLFPGKCLIVVGGEDESYFVERLETGGRRFNSCRSLKKRRSSENRTLSTCSPTKLISVET